MPRGGGNVGWNTEKSRANQTAGWLTTPNTARVLGCHPRQVAVIALRSGIRTQVMPGRWLKFNREDCEGSPGT